MSQNYGVFEEHKIMSQDISSTNLAANAAAAARTICVELRVAWGRTSWPSDWSSQSQNETARLLEFSVQRQLALDPLQLGTARPAELSLTLDNRDQRFSPFNVSSPITADILGSDSTAGGTSVTYPRLYGSPVRLRVGYVDGTNGNEFVTVFSGYVDNAPADSYGTSGDRLTLQCLDRGVELVERRHSTTMHAGLRADEWIGTVLNQAGLSRSLDVGTFYVPFVWMDDETLWQECQDAAAGDGGWFFVDELGVATFRAATWWATDTDSTTVQATITLATFQDIVASIDWSTLATELVFEYTPRVPGGEQDLYRSQDVIVLPLGETSIDARFGYPMDVGDLPKPAWSAISAGGRRLSDVFLTFSDTSAQRTTLHFTNNSGETAFVPPFQIRGNAVLGPQAKTKEHVLDGLAPFDKTAHAGGGPYVQTDAQAAMLAVVYGDRLRYPRMTYNVSGFKALPWLQMGDLVRISVSEPYTSARDMIVTGISMTWRPGAPLLQTLTGVDRAGLYEYDDYFVIGTSEYGEDTVSQRGRVWL